MRAKLLTISAAIAGLLALPAVASAQAKVSVYGLAHVSIDSFDGKGTTGGADAGSKLAVSSNASRLGVKAEADLGGGLKGIAQYEATMAADGEGDVTTATTTVSGVTGATATTSVSGTGSALFGAARNSFVGLKGGFGTILAGIYDTPSKSVGRAVEFFPEYIGDARNLTEQDPRPSNVVAYMSPSFSGVNVNLLYGVDEDQSKKQDILSGNVTYTGGPVWVGLAYENYKNPSSFYETLMRIAAKYKAGPVTVGALYQQGDKKANKSGDDRTTWGLGASYAIGQAVVKAQYYNADKLGSTANSGATLLVAGADYNLGKQTTVYVAYAQTNNEASAKFTANGPSAGVHRDSMTPATGNDPSGFSIGMIQKF